jgi:hypothetical protein
MLGTINAITNPKTMVLDFTALIIDFFMIAVLPIPRTHPLRHDERARAVEEPSSGAV